MNRTLIGFCLMLFVTFAFAQEECEVTSPDGTVSFVTCCELGLGDEPSDECAGVAAASNSQEIRTLKALVAQQTLNGVAQYLRKNPQTPLGYLRIDQVPVIEVYALCCSCVPGTPSCPGSPIFVCSQSRDGTCPADTIRTICDNVSTEPGCVGLD